MGIAAPGIAPEFHLSKQALGYVLTASPLGLFFGAFIGGRIADFWGRKNALILSIILFGAFQLATAWAPGYTELLVIRFLCGLGLGGAFPNLIALTAEASGGRNNILNVVITAAGMPTGGAVAALIGFSAGPGGDWRTVFYVGGIAPLVLAPIMIILLPESSLFRRARSASPGTEQQRGVIYTLFHPLAPTADHSAVDLLLLHSGHHPPAAQLAAQPDGCKGLHQATGVSDPDCLQSRCGTRVRCPRMAHATPAQSPAPVCVLCGARRSGARDRLSGS